MSHRFEMTWGGANENKMIILRWAISLNYLSDCQFHHITLIVLSVLQQNFNKFDKMTGLPGEWQWESNSDDTEPHCHSLWEKREKDAVLLPAIHIDCEKLKAWFLLSAPFLGGINSLIVPREPLTTRALWWGAKLDTGTLYAAVFSSKYATAQHSTPFEMNTILLNSMRLGGEHNHWVQCSSAMYCQRWHCYQWLIPAGAQNQFHIIAKP